MDAMLLLGALVLNSYDIRVAAGDTNTGLLMQGIINSPTPGPVYLVKPATPAGTLNEATPNWAYGLYLGVTGLPAGTPANPVASYLTTDQRGNALVVNVTLPGHQLFPGVVVRQAVNTDSGSMIRNEGEGTAWLQAPASGARGMIADAINNAWKTQSQQIIDGVRTMDGNLRPMANEPGNQYWSTSSGTGTQTMQSVSPR